MVISRYGQITFRHFQDNPYWASAAGYDFNFIDCLSVSAQVVANISHHLFDDIASLPDTEVRELPVFFIKFTFAVLMISLMLSGYPIFAVVIYFRCLSGRKKYSGEHNDTVSNNMRVWIKQCDRRWERKNG